MNESILCLTALCLLGWVAYLKWEIAKLKEEMEKLARRLKRVMRDHGGKLELGDDAAVWGQKPGWMK